MAKTAEADIKPAKSENKKAAPKAEKNIFQRLMQYFRDVRSEMRRVVWPSRQEVINSSVVVVVTLIFFIAFTLIVDSIAVQAIDLISKLG
jgi:preprotein translocase subunit SecE